MTEADNERLVERASPPRAASGVFLATALLAFVVFLALPDGGLGQALVFASLNASASIALWWRVLRRDLTGWPWSVLAGANVFYLAATFAWYPYIIWSGRTFGYPSVPDFMYWAAYLGWGLFLVGLSTRRQGTDRGSSWEAIAASVGLSVVVWRVLLEPALEATAVPDGARVASVVYPILLLMLAALGVRVAILREHIRRVDFLLVGWLTLELVADVWYSLAATSGTFSFGSPWFGLWLVAYGFFGALALHPDAASLTEPDPHRHSTSPKRRLLVLGAITAAALAAVASHAEEGHRLETVTMATAVAATLGIVLYRLASTSRDLAVEQSLREELERTHKEIEYAAAHDYLTGVANRAEFDKALHRAFSRRQAQGRSPCVLVIDLDSFKSVNDTFGHQAGDEVLRVTASRLRDAVRPQDTVARLGGDEFAVVVDDADARTAIAVGERVIAALREPLVLGSMVVASRVSVGAHVSDERETPNDALLCADTAMYAAKTAGGGFELFDAARHRHFIERYQTELELGTAVFQDQLVLHYQPVLDLTTRRIVKSEALLRWEHPTRGLLYPGAFIEIAETSGAIVEVGRWVLRRAFRDACMWQTLAGCGGVGVAVNLSRRQLQNPAVVDDIAEALHYAELDPRLATIEVTETALMVDTCEMVARLEKIKSLGVEIAMDDFGTGYSSLSHLRELPIDLLKIDKAFVDGIASGEEEWSLAVAIVRLATSLGKRTLAEGIEEASQLAHLRTLGCEFGQGWLFAKALPLEDFTALLLPEHAPGAV
ncbi:MAG: putative bifunctional diguanylate cyclase/phosphodiesterase [Acidimicrobiia bacterium]